MPPPPPSASAPHAPPPQRPASAAIQQSIARIQEACQAPPLAPPEYRLLFEIMAKEINDNDLIGAQTLSQHHPARPGARHLDVRRDDVRFVLEVVSEADPWFEQGASANLFAGRFRNFVVARCRGQGLNLSADELDLIDAWFAGGAANAAPAAALRAPAEAVSPQPAAAPPQYRPIQPPRPQPAAAPAPAAAAEPRGERWWSLDEGRDLSAAQRQSQALADAPQTNDEMPRIVRTRLRS